MNDGNPQQRDEHHHDCGHTPYPHQSRLRGTRPELAVEVDGEERRRGVESAGERAHQRREEAGDHEAPDPGRHDRLNQHRERPLSRRGDHLPARVDQATELRHAPGAGEGERDHARDDEDEDRQQLEERGEDGPAPRLTLVGRAERALNDVLIGAPVPQPDDRRAQQHSGPRIVLVEVPRHAAGFLYGRPGGLHAGRRHGLPEVEELGPKRRAQLSPAAQLAQAEEREQQRPQHEHGGLNGLGIGDGPHAADHGVEARQQHERDRSDPEAVEDDAADLDLHVRKQRAEHDAAGEDPHRDLGQHVGNERDHRQDESGRRREAALEEFGHRVDAGAQIERRHHPAEHQQAPRVQLVVREGDAAGRAGASQPDQVLRADVRREDGGANDHPAEVAAGEEVVVRRVAIPENRPPRQAEQQDEVGRDDEPVEPGHRSRATTSSVAVICWAELVPAITSKAHSREFFAAVRLVFCRVPCRSRVADLPASRKRGCLALSARGRLPRPFSLP